MKTYTLGDLTLQIIQDEHPNESPRDWDNLGTMAFAHRRYNLGDYAYCKENGLNNPDKVLRIVKRKDVIALKVYMLDHSGITISTSDFNDKWDSGMIGYIFVTHKEAREQMGWKVLTAARKEKIKTYLEGEVETYDQYLRGDIYGFKIVDKDGEEQDSCWGFYGDDVAKNGMLDHIGDEWKEIVSPKMVAA